MAMLQTRRLDQTIRRIEGMLLKMRKRLGVALLVRGVPELAPNRANKAVGRPKFTVSKRMKR